MRAVHIVETADIRLVQLYQGPEEKAYAHIGMLTYKPYKPSWPAPSAFTFWQKASHWASLLERHRSRCQVPRVELKSWLDIGYRIWLLVLKLHETVNILKHHETIWNIFNHRQSHPQQCPCSLADLSRAGAKSGKKNRKTMKNTKTNLTTFKRHTKACSNVTMDMENCVMALLWWWQVGEISHLEPSMESVQFFANQHFGMEKWCKLVVSWCFMHDPSSDYYWVQSRRMDWASTTLWDSYHLPTFRPIYSMDPWMF